MQTSLLVFLLALVSLEPVAERRPGCGPSKRASGNNQTLPVSCFIGIPLTVSIEFQHRAGIESHPHQQQVSSSIKRPEKKLVILDTDPGLDDMYAAFVILADPTVHVLAMTTVHGNSPLNQTTQNLMRILRVAGKLKIPVYMGAELKLSGDRSKTDDYFGKDGFGDSPDATPVSKKPNRGHAANQIVDLVRRHPRKISLVAIGSLTNIALAYLLEPNLFNLIKELVIMGGNYRGIGNITPYAEFNFYSDPDAASVVMNHVTAPTILVPWEFCVDNAIAKSRIAEYLVNSSIKADFVKKVCKKHWANSESTLTNADGLAAVVWLHPEIVTGSFQATLSVERHNATTQGLVYVEKKPEGNIKIITKAVFKKLYDYMFGALYC